MRWSKGSMASAAGMPARGVTPDLAQQAGGHVEQTLAFVIAGFDIIQESGRFFIHLDTAAGRRDPVDRR
jgi:hypothetical protein